MDMLKDERFDFTILENDIVRNTEKYNKNELLAYIAISFHADNKTGTCFPSYESIARIMRTSRTTAINAIQGLVEKGVIKLENRKSDEKKKELTSNLYTLVSNKFWEQVQAENRLYLIKKGADYKKRYAKGKATKIANKNAKAKEELENGKKNTPDSTAIETDVNNISLKNNSFVNTIVPQETKDCNDSHKEISPKKEQNMSDALKQRLDLLKDAGIKYVPYKSEPELIEGLDLEILKRAIDITVEQSTSRSWKYLLPTYDSECVKINRAKENQQKETQPKFVPNHKPRYQTHLKGGLGMAQMRIGEKELLEYDADEFNRMVALKQAEKWGHKPLY